MTLKAHALNIAQQLASRLEIGLSISPLAIAGGYVRDLALGHIPKDVDVWMDSGNIAESPLEVANRACRLLGPGWSPGVVLKSYGTWSKDIDWVAKVHYHGPCTYSDGCFVDGLPVPGSIDLIALRRDGLEALGHEVGTRFSRQTFGAAVCVRVDLRANAIGATSEGPVQVYEWDADVEAKRLVVQNARIEECMRRIDKRLARLSTTKYAGWGCFYEGPNGELSEHLCPS